MYCNQSRLTRAVHQALFIGAAMGLSASAWAGDAPAVQQTGSEQPATTQDARKAKAMRDEQKQAEQGTELTGMVVTAQSRAQEVEKVPIAIDVVTAADIEKLAATDISKMDMFVPGLVVSGSSPTQPAYAIRGIGGSGFGVGTDPAVGVYVDGVYAARSGAALLGFNDAKRVEVLKGPQGTLFGRNAAAGAISIITNRPSTAGVEAKATLRIGNYGQRWGSALLNLPAGENMAFRFSVVDNQSDGWQRDAATGEYFGKNDDWGARLGGLWNTDNSQFWLTWQHEKLDQPEKANTGLIPLSDDPNQRAPYPADPSTYLNPLHAPLYQDALGHGEHREFDDVALHIDHYMDWATLSSITSWRRFDTGNLGDGDGTNHIATYLAANNIEHNESWYQEFKLSGNTGLIDWVAGVSAYRENADQDSQIILRTNSIDSIIVNTGIPTGTPDGTLYNYFSQVLASFGLPYTLLGDSWTEDVYNEARYSSYAAYGDVIWHLSDQIELTTGGRFTYDNKRFTWLNKPRYAPELDATIAELDKLGIFAQTGLDPAVFQQNLVFPNAVGIPVQHDNSWNDFSPRVVLTDHFTPETMGYISVAKGYKAGGYDSVDVGAEFDPEKVWNYEAGVKSVFPEQNLVLNASVYHYNYSNLQTLTLDTNTPSGIPKYTADTSDQKANGMDLALQWSPIEALILNANATYLDQKYGKKITVNGIDLSGQPTGQPKVNYALGMQYKWHVPGGEMVFDLNHAYRGPSRCNRSSTIQGTCQVSPNFMVGTSKQRTDARLGWSTADDRWGVAMFVNNLFDKRYVTGVGNITTSVLGTPWANITPPRMYGVEFRVQL